MFHPKFIFIYQFMLSLFNIFWVISVLFNWYALMSFSHFVYILLCKKQCLKTEKLYIIHEIVYNDDNFTLCKSIWVYVASGKKWYKHSVLEGISSSVLSVFVCRYISFDSISCHSWTHVTNLRSTFKAAMSRK